MRADRLLAIMMLLQTRGKMTAQSLADKLEVSRRTILRDIDALSSAGVPIYAEGGHGGGIALDENYRTTLAGLQDREIRTLFVGNNAQLLREIGLGDAAESTMLKLLAVLPTSHRPSVEHIRQRILIDPTWWWHDTQPLAFWDQLQQAVYEDRCIRTVYERHNGEVVARILEPYSLVAKSSVWYLVAQHDDELRTYRISRFRQITLLDTHFQRRKDFDLPTYWREHQQNFVETLAEYRFTLCIQPDRLNFLKWLVPGRYHPVEPPDADGWITVNFDLESIELAKMLIFGLEGQATVVEPPELQEAILDTAGKILNNYTRTKG
ncbi:MAG: transcriptional regulator [Chloroflexota bacterium]|nr:MAG: transcriptional regulator [Chloroflexota bacterium]